LVYNSNNYGLWYVNDYSYWGESKPTNITEGHHIVGINQVPQTKTTCRFQFPYTHPSTSTKLGGPALNEEEEEILQLVRGMCHDPQQVPVSAIFLKRVPVCLRASEVKLMACFDARNL